MDLGKLLNNDGSPGEHNRGLQVNDCFDNFQSSSRSHVTSEARLSALYYGREDHRVPPPCSNRGEGFEGERGEFRKRLKSPSQAEDEDEIDMKKKFSELSNNAEGLTDKQLEQKKRQLKNEMERKRVYKTNAVIDRMRLMLQDVNRRTKPDKYSTLIDMGAYVRELQQENITLKNRLAALLRTGGNSGDPGGGETCHKDGGSETKLQSSVSGSSNTADLSSRSSSNDGDDCGSNAPSTNSCDDTSLVVPPQWKRQRLMETEAEGADEGVLNLLVGGEV